MERSLKRLNESITRCKKCPRLVEWRRRVAAEKTARFSEWTYWGKPVPGFGDTDARLLIVGLAPAAHGANRTGRMFTGDRSGEWLYRALHEFGFANQPDSVSRGDSMRLDGCYITAVVHCAPPLNKPSKEEIATCRSFLLTEMHLLTKVRVILALGGVAFSAAWDAGITVFGDSDKKRPKFAHGLAMQLNDHTTLLTSYHPSQQNTFTGRLTQKMFHDVFRKVRTLA
jgi:uracil-DNA glycosylase